MKLFFNGKVYVEREIFSEAFVVDGGLILEVGGSDELLRKYDCEKIDLKGRTVVPGFNDSHLHLLMAAETSNQVNLYGVKSIDEIIDRAVQFMKDKPHRVEKGISSIGWNQDLFEGDKRMPNRHDLDRISKDIPVVLERVCGHILTVNTKAIELLGFNCDTGKFKEEINLSEVEFEEGYPNGIFKEGACSFAKSIIPKFTNEERLEFLAEIIKKASSLGLTTVQSNDTGTTLTDTEEGMNLIKEFFQRNNPPIRYHHQVCFNDVELFKKYVEEGLFNTDKYTLGDRLTVGPLKLFKDGSLGARTALMKDGYVGDRDNHGQEWMSNEVMREYIYIASKNGIQVVTHVIGDKAVEDMADLYIESFKDGKNELRHALVHCQITDEKLLKKIEDNDLYVLAQPIFIDYDMTIVEDLCGKDLASTSYAFGTLYRKGVHVSLGTDAPVESFNPFENIYEAVTRKNRAGEPERGFFPEHAMDIYEAIDCYTIESAYLEFKEDYKGRIKENYLADFVVLDRDIFTIDPMEIKDILPMMTVLGGEIVYQGGGGDGE